jgi:hypothetical protein
LKEISDVLERAAAGDLEARIVLGQDASEIRRLSDNVNRALDIVDAALAREARAALACVRDGLLQRRIVERGLTGWFGSTAQTTP